MKKCQRCDKCGKYLFLIPALLNQRREKRSAGGENLLNAQNTEKLVSVTRSTEVFIVTSSDEADEATKLPKIPIIPLI